MGPAPKVFRPMINRDALVDPNSSDHVVAITELREQVATLQKQLSNKDQQLFSKEKQVGIILNFSRDCICFLLSSFFFVSLLSGLAETLSDMLDCYFFKTKFQIEANISLTFSLNICL